VADDINILADANNDIALPNHDFPALWQKRALENAAAHVRRCGSPYLHRRTKVKTMHNLIAAGALAGAAIITMTRPARAEDWPTYICDLWNNGHAQQTRGIACVPGNGAMHLQITNEAPPLVQALRADSYCRLLIQQFRDAPRSDQLRPPSLTIVVINMDAMPKPADPNNAADALSASIAIYRASSAGADGPDVDGAAWAKCSY
jgi:hypothetical protein